MNSNHFFLYDFYLLRTHTFPIESVLELNQEFEKYERDITSQDAVDCFKRYFSNSLFQEAVYFSSKDLYYTMIDWLNGKVFSKEKVTNILRTLHRYYTRMSSRCTPYGLYSGFATGDILNCPTHVQFASERLNRFARFDMNFLNKIADKLSKSLPTCEKVTYYPNPTIYKIGDRFLYTEQVTISGRPQCVLSSIRDSRYINIVLERSRNGATIEELIQVVLEPPYTYDRIKKFIFDLVSCEFLTSKLKPTITGSNTVKSFITNVKKVIDDRNIIESINANNTILFNENLNVEIYESVSDSLISTFGSQNSDVVQIDLKYNMHKNNLNREIIEEIVLKSEKLWAIAQPSVSSALRDFVSKFQQRYEEQEIPILHALDPNYGIGYGLASNGTAENMPLLHKLALPREKVDTRSQKNAYEKFLDKKMFDFYRNGSGILNITDSDLDELNNNLKPATPMQHYNAYIFGTFLSPSQQDLDKRNYKFLCHQLHAYSAGRLLGRFAVVDPYLQEKLQICIDDEEEINSEFILAEVLYTPDGRGANVVTRPKFRNFEIPCNVSSTSDENYIIEIQDLFVSVRNGRLILRSRKYNKEVLPQVNNAHNASWSDPIYRFLSDVRSQFVNPGFNWEWLSYNKEPYLPRVEYENFILSRARWTIEKFNKKSGNNPDIDSYLQSKRKEYSIPRFVVLVHDGDNELLIDLDNHFSRQQVCRRLKSNKAHLLEFLTDVNNCFIKDHNGGSYTNQVIIPLGSKHPNYPKSSIGFRSAGHAIDLTRSFIPGSEWMYFKVYGGNTILENILTDIIKPELDKAVESKAIDKWFFIRFHDPENHLRIRFHTSGHGKEAVNIYSILSKHLNPFVEKRQITKVVLDTYNREIERYRPETMVESETLFFYDSVAVLNALDLYDGDHKENMRWQIAAYSIDKMLDDFMLSTNERYLVIDALRNTFFKEFSNNDLQDEKVLEVSLNNKFRADRDLLESILSKDSSLGKDGYFGFFNQRSRNWHEQINSIRSTFYNSPENKEILFDLIQSYVHMTINRIFLAKHRTHEMILYHYLSKFYKSVLARNGVKKYESFQQHI